MTVMSREHKIEFYSTARSTFPWDTLFNPMDYFEEFRRLYGGKLTAHTYRKYLSLVARDSQYPAVGRARNSGNDPFLYFLDSSEGESFTQPPADTPKPSTSQVRKTLGLNIFVSRLRSVIKPNQWYSVEGLRRKYHSNNFRKLRKETVSSYLSQVVREGLWPGLERECKGVRGSYMYRWVRPDIKHTRWDSTEDETVTVTPVPAQTGARSIEYVCKACGESSPCGAKFCMHCGTRVEPTYIRTLVQELVTHIPVDLGSLTEEQIVAFVKKWALDRIQVTVEKGESGEQIALVSVGKSK